MARLEEALAALSQSQTASNQRMDALSQSMAALAQAQAIMVQTEAKFVAEMAEMERDSRARFARIEADMASVLRILAEHGRILQALPEAVRDKIGFKPPA